MSSIDMVDARGRFDPAKIDQIRSEIPVPDSAPKLVSASSDTFELIEGVDGNPALLSSPMRERNFNAHYKHALEKTGVEYELVPAEGVSNRVVVSIKDSGDLVNTGDAISALEGKGVAVSAKTENARVFRELIDEMREPASPPRPASSPRKGGVAGAFIGMGVMGAWAYATTGSAQAAGQAVADAAPGAATMDAARENGMSWQTSLTALSELDGGITSQPYAAYLNWLDPDADIEIDGIYSAVAGVATAVGQVAYSVYDGIANAGEGVVFEREHMAEIQSMIRDASPEQLHQMADDLGGAYPQIDFSLIAEYKEAMINEGMKGPQDIEQFEHDIVRGQIDASLGDKDRAPELIADMRASLGQESPPSTGPKLLNESITLEAGESTRIAGVELPPEVVAAAVAAGRGVAGDQPVAEDPEIDSDKSELPAPPIHVAPAPTTSDRPR
jgi:hypothetical protein